MKLYRKIFTAILFAATGTVSTALAIPGFDGSAGVFTAWQAVNSTSTNTASSPISGSDSLAATVSPEGLPSPNINSQYSVNYASISLAGHAESPGNVDFWFGNTAAASGDWQDTITFSTSDPNLAGGTVSIRPVITISGLPSSFFYNDGLGGNTGISWSVTLRSTLGDLYDNGLPPNLVETGVPTLSITPLTASLGQPQTFQLSAQIAISAAGGGGNGFPLDPTSISASLNATLLGFVFSDALGHPISSITATGSSDDGVPSTIPTILPGDANADGTINLTDLATILNNFGQTNSNWTAGNFDNASTIDLSDLADVLNNFGQSLPNPTIPTPEPSSLILLTSSALLLTRRRR